MSKAQFFQLLADAQLLQRPMTTSGNNATTTSSSDSQFSGGGVLTESRIHALFQNVQQDEDYGDDNPELAENMSYQEFLGKTA